MPTIILEIQFAAPAKAVALPRVSSANISQAIDQGIAPKPNCNQDECDMKYLYYDGKGRIAYASVKEIMESRQDERTLKKVTKRRTKAMDITPKVESFSGCASLATRDPVRVTAETSIPPAPKRINVLRPRRLMAGMAIPEETRLTTPAKTVPRLLSMPADLKKLAE